MQRTGSAPGVNISPSLVDYPPEAGNDGGGNAYIVRLKSDNMEFPQPSFLSRIGVRDDGSGIQDRQGGSFHRGTANLCFLDYPPEAGNDVVE